MLQQFRSSNLSITAIFALLLVSIGCSEKLDDAHLEQLLENPMSLITQQPGVHAAIIYSNDIQARVTPVKKSEEQVGSILERARFIIATKRRFADNKQPLLLVDSGNLLFHDKQLNEPLQPHHQRTVELAKTYVTLGYHAVAVGAFDAAAGLEFLSALEKQTRLPLINSNIVTFTKPETPMFTPYKLVQLEGKTFGVLAITSEKTFAAHKKYLHARGYQIKDPTQAASQLAIELRQQGADIVIALSNMAWEEQIQLTSTLENVDLIIASNDGVRTSVPLNNQHALLVQTPRYGSYIGLMHTLFQDDAKEFYDASLYLHRLQQLAILKKNIENAKEKSAADEQRSVDLRRQLARADADLKDKKKSKKNIFFNSQIKISLQTPTK